MCIHDVVDHEAVIQLEKKIQRERTLNMMKFFHGYMYSYKVFFSLSLKTGGPELLVKT